MEKFLSGLLGMQERVVFTIMSLSRCVMQMEIKR